MRAIRNSQHIGSLIAETQHLSRRVQRLEDRRYRPVRDEREAEFLWAVSGLAAPKPTNWDPASCTCVVNALTGEESTCSHCGAFGY